jgi:large subunit ribosomal protein L6
MSRVAKAPIPLPQGVVVECRDGAVRVKGSKGELALTLVPHIKLMIDAEDVTVQTEKDDQFTYAMSGTTRALLANMVHGVSQGFEKKLILKGVGYRAEVKGKTLHLTLGFSHPVAYSIPEGATIETPSQTEVIVKGVDKQLVGQVAANIRQYRPPEPYKGKGVRYADEVIIQKEGKKK